MIKSELKATMLVALFALGLLPVSQTEACTASQAPPINYFFSTEMPSSGNFYDGQERSRARPTIIEGCKDAAGQFLMVALALRTQKPNGKSGDLNFTSHYTPDQCRILNNPFPSEQRKKDKLNSFLEGFAFLRSCTYYDVKELEGNTILLPETEPAATMVKISPDHIIFYGDFFYLKIQKTSRFGISVGLRKECTDVSYINRQGLKPGEIQSLLNTYIAGDASGLTTDLTAIGSSKIRLLLNPNSNSLSYPSAPVEINSPFWPDTWRGGVELGAIGIKPEKDSRTRVDLQLLMDHFGSSEDSYLTPVAGKVELSDLSGARNKVVDSWYFGDIAPPQYQGFLTGLPRMVTDGIIQKGKRYRIQFSMADPNEDFLLFKTGMKQMLVDLSSLIGLPGVDILDTINSLTALTEGKTLNGLAGLSGTDAEQVIQNSLDDLSQRTNNPSWPPEYKRACLSRDGTCTERGQHKWIKRLGAEFTIGGQQADEHYELLNLTEFSEDLDHPYREWSTPALPQLDCSAQNSPESDVNSRSNRR